MSLWDHTAKKRLKQYPKYSSAVNSLAFDHTGTHLAIGISYAWDQGAEGAKKDDGKVEIRIREVGDEVKVSASVSKSSNSFSCLFSYQPRAKG